MTKISTTNAHQDKLFYVALNVVAYRESDGKCLILKRALTEKVHPGKWCVPGGKMEHEDFIALAPSSTEGKVTNFDNAVPDTLNRELKEEAGISIEGELVLVGHKMMVRPDEVPVLILTFGAHIQDESQLVMLEKKAFTEWAWVDGDEIDSYDCIEGVSREIRQVCEKFS